MPALLLDRDVRFLLEPERFRRLTAALTAVGSATDTPPPSLEARVLFQHDLWGRFDALHALEGSLRGRGAPRPAGPPARPPRADDCAAGAAAGGARRAAVELARDRPRPSRGRPRRLRRWRRVAPAGGQRRARGRDDDARRHRRPAGGVPRVPPESGVRRRGRLPGARVPAAPGDRFRLRPLGPACSRPAVASSSWRACSRSRRTASRSPRRSSPPSRSATCDRSSRAPDGRLELGDLPVRGASRDPPGARRAPAPRRRSPRRSSPTPRFPPTSWPSGGRRGAPSCPLAIVCMTCHDVDGSELMTPNRHGIAPDRRARPGRPRRGGPRASRQAGACRLPGAPPLLPALRRPRSARARPGAEHGGDDGVGHVIRPHPLGSQRVTGRGSVVRTGGVHFSDEGYHDLGCGRLRDGQRAARSGPAPRAAAGSLMVGDLVRTLYRYNAWANGRVLDTAAGLTPGAAPGRRRRQLRFRPRHAGPRDERPVDIPRALAGTLAARRRWIPGSSPTWHRSGRGGTASSDGPRRSSPVSTTRGWRPSSSTSTSPASAGPIPLWQQMLHQVNHATQHRSEAAVMLTQLRPLPGLA